MQSTRTVTVALAEAETRDLLERVHRAYHTRIDELLLCALARAYRAWSGTAALLLHLESHGREDLFEDVDLARTVGWFTTLYPVLLTTTGGLLTEDIIAIKEQLRAIPHKGIGYGVLQYLGDATVRTESERHPVPISFNYLGQFDQAFHPHATFSFAGEASGADVGFGERRAHALDIVGHVQGGRLSVTFYYSAALHRHETIARLADAFRDELTRLIAHCLAPQIDAVALSATASVKARPETDASHGAQPWPSFSPLTYTQLDQWFMYFHTGNPWPVSLEYEINGPLAVERLGAGHQHRPRSAPGLLGPDFPFRSSTNICSTIPCAATAGRPLQSTGRGP